MDEDNGRMRLLWLDAVMLGLWLVMGMLLAFGMIFILPKFTELFMRLNVDLPETTRLTLGISRICCRYWWAILPLAATCSALPIITRPGRSWPIYLICAMITMILTVGAMESVTLPFIKDPNSGSPKRK